MGTVTTDRVLTGPWGPVENHGARGTFGIMSRDYRQPIMVELHTNVGVETVELVHIGDACQFPLLNVNSVRVYAGSGIYPSNILIVETTLDQLRVLAAPYLAGGDPAHPVPVSGVAILTGTVDPSAGLGVTAPVGWLYGRDNAGAGEVWLKTSAPDTGWTQITVP